MTTEVAEFDPPRGPNGLRKTDEELARFATPGWVDGIAKVPIAEVATMIAEDPSIVSALIGALRHARGPGAGGLVLGRFAPAGTEQLVLTRDLDIVPNGFRVFVQPAPRAAPGVRAVAPPMTVLADAVGQVERGPLGILQQLEYTTIGAPPREQRGDYDGLWTAGRHFDEQWSIGETYATRQEAINAYADDYGEPDGESFHTAKLVYKRETPPFPYDADAIIEQVGEHMYSEWWESAIESFVDGATGPHGKELEAALEMVWIAWCAKHDLELHGYTVTEEEHHVVGEDEDDETLAQRKRDEAGARGGEPAP